MENKLFAGTYRILAPRKIGLPSLVAYRAIHVPSNAPCEIRVLPYGIDETGESFARFHGDFRRLFALDHPAMIPVSDAGAEQGRAYYVVHPREGASLSAHDLTAPMEASRALRLLRPVAEALAAMHADGLVHGEIDTDTVWLNEDQSELFVAAFPLRRYFRLTNLTAQGIVGPLRIDRAPEQLHDEEPTVRTDVFLFALLALEFLCGYSLLAPGYVLKRPTGGIPGLSSDAAELLLGSLAVLPAHRPPTMDCLLDGLAEA